MDIAEIERAARGGVAELTSTYTTPMRLARAGVHWKARGASIRIPAGTPTALEILAPGITIEGLDVSGGTIGIAVHADRVTLRDCKIHDVFWRCTSRGGAGVDITGELCSVTGCEITRIGAEECRRYSGIRSAKPARVHGCCRASCSPSPPLSPRADP